MLKITIDKKSLNLQLSHVGSLQKHYIVDTMTSI